MSTKHTDHIAAQLSIGAEQPFTLADLYTKWDLPIEQLLALGDQWAFVPESEYCPASGVPDWATTPGLHTQGDRAAVCVDNGMFLACFLLKLEL